MPTSSEISKILYYKSLGKGFTDQGKEFFEEDPSIDAFSHVDPNQIWVDADDIPETSPFGLPNSGDMNLYDRDVSGAVQYFHNLQLLSKPILGDRTFYHPDLKDAIPFNFGDGSYNYHLSTQGDFYIAPGNGDWVLDVDQGKITFYESPPSGVSTSSPPRVSFYKYVGKKGLNEIDVSTLNVSAIKFIGKDGVLEAVDGSVYAVNVEPLKAYDVSIYPNGLDTEFPINHNLQTPKHDITVIDVSLGNEKIYPDIEVGKITSYLYFHEPPEIGKEFGVYVMGFGVVP